MNPAVEGYTSEIVEAADPAELAAQLGAIERMVERTPALRSALTDTAVEPRARRAILAELLESKVGDPARRLAAYVVSAVPAPDALGALNWVAHRAASPAETPTLLGHQAARERVGGYAAAVFEELSTEQLEEVEDQLFRFARIVEAHPDLRADLTDRELPVEVRQGIVQDLLEHKVDAATLRLLRFLIAGGRPRDFLGALDWLVEKTAEARGWRVAHVHSAVPIDDAQRDELSGALGRLAGVPVELQVTIVPELIGGAIVQIGNLRVDSSARGRLDRLREELVPAGNAAERGRGTGEP